MLNMSEILPVCLVDRLYLSVVVTYRRQILYNVCDFTVVFFFSLCM